MPKLTKTQAAVLTEVREEPGTQFGFSTRKATIARKLAKLGLIMWRDRGFTRGWYPKDDEPCPNKTRC